MVSFEAGDVRRPIEPPTTWKRPADCLHPWSRVAFVTAEDLVARTSPESLVAAGVGARGLYAKRATASLLQCADCGTVLKSNGYLFMFEQV